MNSNATSGKPVKLERDGAVATLTLARAEMHNALVPELLEPLLTALEQLHTDASIRAVVLAAEGPAFSIGGDMRRFHAESEVGAANLIHYSGRLVGLLNRTVLAMVNLPQPVIAAVHGTVTGGSIGFVAGADLLVLAESAVFKAHYANAGFCPDGGWTACMGDLIGTRRAAAALLLNRSITASEALEWGLATELAPADQVLSRALKLASKIAGYAPGTMRHAKRLLASDAATLAARLEAERRGFLELVGTDTARAGVVNFLDTFKNYPGGKP
ncbi:MAG: enoyl-CoA hydratase/isomerase family protein [Betaproteobacteria bacterium]